MTRAEGKAMAGKRAAAGITAAFALGASGYAATAADAAAQPAPHAVSEVVMSEAVPSAPDYTQPKAWLCRPGRQDACTGDLDALRIDATGARTPAPFKAAVDPPVDCFYVYPTVSHQPAVYSDAAETRDETSVVRAQAARMRSVCRVYAPLYRSATLTGLMASLRPGGRSRGSYDVPYADVRAAWRSYIEHDNRGRGVVLFGHSQGSIHLLRLLKEEIDGKPAQARLVSAILAGPRFMTTARGRVVGGTLQSIPLCGRADQTGCVVAWSTYEESDASPARVFGHDMGDLAASCVNPAAPGGGRAPLKADLPRPPDAPASDPPFLEVMGLLTAECVTDAQGSVLRVRVGPGAAAERLRSYELAVSVLPGWGLHVVDVGFTAGDLRDLVRSEGAAWTAAHPPG